MCLHSEHTSPHRKRTLRGIVQRRNLELVVVESDVRTTWPHYEAPHQLGLPLSVPQLTDTYLYLAATIAAGAARGIRTALLASEFECSMPDEYEGRTFFPASHLAYSQVVLGALTRLLEPWGIECASLIGAPTGFQRQEMIVRKGSDLVDLQFSCFWMDNDNNAYCSRCSKCFRIALLVTALDVDPARLGIDTDRLFVDPPDEWLLNPLQFADSLRFGARRTSPRKARRHFKRGGLPVRLGLRSSPALEGLRHVLAKLEGGDPVWVSGRRPGYEAFLPTALRGRIAGLFGELWPNVDASDRTRDLGAIRDTLGWITKPATGCGSPAGHAGHAGVGGAASLLKPPLGARSEGSFQMPGLMARVAPGGPHGLSPDPGRSQVA